MPSLDSFKRKPLVPLESFTGGTIIPVEDFLSPSELRTRVQQTRQRRTIFGEAWETLEQALRGFTSEATLGLSKYAVDEEEPEGTAESIARAIGRFGGFLTTPIKGAKIGLKGIKSILGQLGVKLGDKMIHKVAAHVAESAATLGMAEAISDITDVPGMPERFLHGAKIGTIFGGTSMLHIGANTTLRKAFYFGLRQGVGRMALKVFGEYPEGYFDEENMANAIFGEALNTYFLSKGVDPKNILLGKTSKEVEKEIIQMEMERQKGNTEFLRKVKFQIGEKYLRKPIKKKKELHEIHYDSDIANREQVFSFQDRITNTLKSGGKLENSGLNVILEWNAELGKYIAVEGNELQVALRGLGVNEIPKQMVEIRKPSPADTPGTLPSILGALNAVWGSKFLTTKIIQQIENTGTFIYNVDTGKLAPEFIRPAKIIKPGKNETVVSLTEDGWKIVSKGKGVKIPAKKLATIEANIAKEVAQIKAIPNKEIPESYVKVIDERIGKLDLGTDNSNFFYDAYNMPRKPRYRDLWSIETRLAEVNKKPIGERFEAIFEHWLRSKGYSENIDLAGNKKARAEAPDMAEVIDKYSAERAKKHTAAIYENAKKDGPWLRNALIVPMKRGFLNFGKLMHRLQQDSGLPLYEIYRHISMGQGKRDIEIFKLFKPMNKFWGRGKFNELDEAMVVKYYNNKYWGGDRPVGMTPRQIEYINVADSILKQVAPLVRKYRYVTWAKGREDVLLNRQPRDTVVYKNQEKLTPKLEEGIEHYRLSKMKGKEGALDEWLARPENDRLGLIEEGAYFPAIISGKGFDAVHQDFFKWVDMIGKSHTKARNHFDPEYLHGIYKSEFFDQRLNMRLHNYVKQVMNLEHLEKHLSSLDDLMDMFPEHFSSAKSPGLSRVSADPKAYSTKDALLLFAHRKKGYPIKIGGFGMMAKFAQSLFFRALVLKPFLSVRNVFQRIVTMPHKRVVLDPKYWGKSFKKSIPPEMQERFESYVSQFEQFQHQYMFLEETELLKSTPLIGPIIHLAERIGIIYPLTDLWNRQFVFKQTYLRDMDVMQKYYNGTINAKKLMSEMGMEKIRETELGKRIMSLVMNKQPQEAAFEHGKWMSDNSQWIYERSEKGVFEMTGEGEAFTNLLTWTKGITQRTIEMFQNMNEGYKTKNYKKMRSGAFEFGNLLLAGFVAGEVLKHISVGHGKKYVDYAADSFVWEFGGVSIGILRQVGEQFKGLVTSFDGTEDERWNAVDSFLKFTDNTLLRGLMPFAKQALGVVEAMTSESYISPIYDTLRKRGTMKVDRTMLESFAHAFFATDPNKSEAVRKQANIAKQTWYERYKSGRGATKQFYWAMYQRYKYFDDLFTRYEPVEVYKMYWDKELERLDKLYDKDYTKELTYKMERKQRKAERKYRIE